MIYLCCCCYCCIGILLARFEVHAYIASETFDGVLSKTVRDSIKKTKTDFEWLDQLFSLGDAELVRVSDVVQDPDPFSDRFVSGWEIQMEDCYFSYSSHVNI